MSYALRTNGIGIPDDALSPWCSPRWNRDVRIIAEVAFELGDEVAWWVLVGDAASRTILDKRGRAKIVLAGPLAIFRQRLPRASRSRRKAPKASQGLGGAERAVGGHDGRLF